MLEAVNLNKFFGSRQALDSVTFSVGSGEVAGVLGSRGSGRSTLMRILAGFLEPTHGTVRVAGMDPRLPRTRQHLGYMPEVTPLPDRMRVREYLRYRCGLKGLYGRSAETAIARAVERCDLFDYYDSIILHLGKGVRQRVGLADCLLASPKVLLLDEPLADLDPERTVETRDLLSRLEGVTILLSSQRLHEVQRICGRLLVLHKGRLLGNDTPENIYERTVAERVINLELVSFEPVRETLRAITGVRTVTVDPSTDAPGTLLVRLTIPAGVDLRRELSQVCTQRGWIVTGMHMEQVRNEDIFQKLAQGR